MIEKRIVLCMNKSASTYKGIESRKSFLLFHSPSFSGLVLSLSLSDVKLGRQIEPLRFATQTLQSGKSLREKGV